MNEEYSQIVSKILEISKENNSIEGTYPPLNTIRYQPT